MAKFNVQVAAVEVAKVVNAWVATGDPQKKDWAYGAIRSFETILGAVKLSPSDASFGRQFCTGMRAVIDPVKSDVEFCK